MLMLAEAFDFWGLVLQNPYFYLFILNPPFIFVCFYLLQKKCLESKYFTWTAGICFVLSVLLLGISVAVGWISCCRYVRYEDVLLEKAIAQYENPPQELIEYYHADGGRNAGLVFLGGVYATIIFFIWSPILLIFWLIDRIITRWKLKTELQTQLTFT